MSKTRTNRDARTAGGVHSRAGDAADGSTRGDRGRFHLHLTGLSLVVVVFGLLLWARFLLVTGHPRTAFAEPEAHPAQTTAAAAAH